MISWSPTPPPPQRVHLFTYYPKTYFLWNADKTVIGWGIDYLRRVEPSWVEIHIGLGDGRLALADTPSDHIETTLSEF